MTIMDSRRSINSSQRKKTKHGRLFEQRKWKSATAYNPFLKLLPIGDIGANDILLFLMIIQLASPASLNSSCPYFCSCRTQPSDLNSSISFFTVNCSFHQLRVLPSGIPKDTECLLITGNRLVEIPENISDLTALKELDLTSNRIKNLGRGFIFHNLSEMNYLNLGKNDLTAIVRDAFNGLSNLKLLVISENKLNYIEDHAFYGLNSLLILDLGRNQFSSLYPEWFYGLPYLQELYLYENRVHLINSATFRSLKRLQHLSLYGNRITHISSDGFWGLYNVNTLHLERNYLETVPLDSLKKLPSLQTLYLSGNPFQRLGNGDFSDLFIEELAINNLPHLQMIESRSLLNLTRLRTLHIENCPKLSYIDADAFVNVTVLHYVYLQNNHLITVPKEVMNVLPPGTEIALKGNPFLCDCNVLWLRQEMELDKLNQSRVKFINSNQLLCDAPQHARSTPIGHLDPSRVLPPQCAPSIYPLMENVIEKRLGDQLHLHCRAAGIPKPSLQWILPRGLTFNNPSNNVHVQIHQSGTLTFRHLKESFSGNYTCVAQNSMGSVNKTILLNVRGIDIHLFPIKVAANFVTIVWNGTERNIFQQFQILYRMVVTSYSAFGSKQLPLTDSQELHPPSVAESQTYNQVTVSPIHRSYTITNLMPDTTYEFCIAFKDYNGYFVHISCTVARTQTVDYMFQGIHHTSNVAVAAVVGILVVMLMVICIATVAARKYRQRQYVCPDKPVCYRMSNIPLENLYSPLMSTVGP